MDEQLGELYETATRAKQMDHKKGIATVFRGNEALGVVEYDFNMTDNGRVTGWIVEVKHINLQPMAPRVPPTLLQKSAGARICICHWAMEPGSRSLLSPPMEPL